MSTLGIIPCRTGSVGVPNKNFKSLAGKAPWVRAVECAKEAGLDRIVLTSDMHMADLCELEAAQSWGHRSLHLLSVGAPLHQDKTPMIDVVRDALTRVPGDESEAVVLIQCTQPLRQPKHITQALALLTPKVHSVVSVVELPEAYSPDWMCVMEGDWLHPYPAYDGQDTVVNYFRQQPTRRQDLQRVYKRDGTVYAFWRKTVTKHWNIYGERVKPLIIPASETCPLDTLEDWAEAERRLLCVNS